MQIKTTDKGNVQGWNIRPSIKMMMEDGLSAFSIVAAHGRMVTPEEADCLTKYDNEKNYSKKD